MDQSDCLLIMISLSDVFKLNSRWMVPFMKMYILYIPYIYALPLCTFPNPVAGTDFEELNTIITFDEDDVEANVRVRIIDNEALQDIRAFDVVIEVIPGQIFPVQVQNNKAIVDIEDDDSKSPLCSLDVNSLGPRTRRLHATCE